MHIIYLMSMETVKVNTTQHIEIDYPVAGLGERVAARLIDFGLFLILIVLLLIGFGFMGLMNSAEMTFVVVMIIYGAGYVFYDLICEIFMNGQSIGKRILKIKVISLDGAQASLGQYFIRWLFRIVDFTLTGWVGGLICVAVTENKQRIGDLVAGTTLIKTQPQTQLAHIAFHPNVEDYTPIFDHVQNLSDRDAELIHEVLNTYHKTGNHDIIFQTAAKVKTLINAVLPSGMHELAFLETVLKDYNHVTSKAD